MLSARPSPDVPYISNPSPNSKKAEASYPSPVDPPALCLTSRLASNSHALPAVEYQMRGCVLKVGPALLFGDLHLYSAFPSNTMHSSRTVFSHCTQHADLAMRLAFVDMYMSRMHANQIIGMAASKAQADIWKFLPSHLYRFHAPSGQSLLTAGKSGTADRTMLHSRRSKVKWKESGRRAPQTRS
jgi:hypothetical protein